MMSSEKNQIQNSKAIHTIKTHIIFRTSNQNQEIKGKGKFWRVWVTPDNKITVITIMCYWLNQTSQNRLPFMFPKNSSIVQFSLQPPPRHTLEEAKLPIKLLWGGDGAFFRSNVGCWDLFLLHHVVITASDKLENKSWQILCVVSFLFQIKTIVFYFR